MARNQTYKFRYRAFAIDVETGEPSEGAVEEFSARSPYQAASKAWSLAAKRLFNSRTPGSNGQMIMMDYIILSGSPERQEA